MPLTNYGVQTSTPTTGPIVLYPRAYVVVKYIYNDGTEAESGLVPSRVTVALHPHHQASMAEVEVSASAIPFDLRRLNGIFVTVYMGAADGMRREPERGRGDVQRQQFMQFVGYCDAESVRRGPDGTMAVIRARDLSSLLRDLRPMYVTKYMDGTTVDPTPLYSDTILQATRRVLEWAGLQDAFEIQDDSGLGSTPLSSLVKDERAVQGHVPVRHRDVSAWEAIEHAAAVANVLVHVELGKIVFRRPADAFALPTDPRTPPKYSFVFGKTLPGYVNAFEVEITKKFLHNRKGVRLVAFEPSSRQVITADFPPNNQVPPKHAPKLGATKQTKPRPVSITAGGGVLNASAVQDPPRDIIAVGGDGVHSVEGLTKLAERYYRERSRQELEGVLITKIWDDKLFALRNGDRIEIRVKPELEAELNNRPDEASAVAYLKRQLDVNDAAAKVMLAQVRNQESTVFYVRSVTHEWSPSGAQTRVDFISIVEL